MEDAIPDQTAAFQRTAETLIKGANFLARAAAVGALTALAPGVPLLLAPVWHRLRNDRDYFKNLEAFQPEFVAEYGIEAHHPQYGALKRQMDALLAQEGQPPAQLLIVDPLFQISSGAYPRSRVILFKEEFIKEFSPDERAVMIKHEVKHLLPGKEMRQRNVAQEFMMNAKQVCLNFGLVTAAAVGVGAKAVEYGAPQLFQKAAEIMTTLPSPMPLTPGNLLLNAALNVMVAYPAAKLAYHALARRAEYACDRFAMDKTPRGVDWLTQTLLRASYLPDPMRRMTLPMRQVLEKPRRVGWKRIKERLSQWPLDEHPTAPERIRAAYAQARREGVTPQLGMNDTWRSNTAPRP